MQPKHLKPVSPLWKRYRRLLILTGCLLICLGGIWSVHTHRAVSAQKVTSPATPAPVTTTQIRHQQRQVKAELKRYLHQQTADGTTSISFYNLGALPKSAAAKDHLTKTFYQPGQLAVSAHAHTAEVSASTYKLYIAAYLFTVHRQTHTAWTPTDQAGFENMILHSANDFSEATLAQSGLSALNQFIHSEHWTTPVFISGEAAQTTAASLTLVLRQLATQRAPFDHAADQQWLLKLMRHQDYRTGIPAGAQTAQRGTTVADKVGWFADTNNDAGIVTLPNGERYILVILTHGHGQTGFSGFPRIAKITTHIQRLVYDPHWVKTLDTPAPH